MNRFFTKENSLEALAALLTIVVVGAVLQTFIVGKHFVIPTMILIPAVFLGNVVRFGLQGKAWAKHMLFWLFAVICAHLCFALVWADTARPGEYLGAAFYPVYGGLLLVFAFLCRQYANSNRLF